MRLVLVLCVGVVACTIDTTPLRGSGPDERDGAGGGAPQPDASAPSAETPEAGAADALPGDAPRAQSDAAAPAALDVRPPADHAVAPAAEVGPIGAVDAAPPAPDAPAASADAGAPEAPAANLPPSTTPRTYGAHAYLFVTEPRAFAEALAFCRDYGYRLVTIESADENAWITSHAVGKTQAVSWLIGLNDLAKRDEWVWEDGSPSSYRNWGPGEPNRHRPADDCVHLVVVPEYFATLPPAGTWDDEPCVDSYPLPFTPSPFVCKR